MIIQTAQRGSEQEAALFRWIDQQLGTFVIRDGSLITGVVVDGELVAAWVFHDYRGHMIDITLASISKRWCTRQSLRAIFHYAFNVADVMRFQAVCHRRNKKMRKLFRGLGFIEEGVLRKGFDGQRDAVLYSMLRDECKWVEINEQESQKAVA